MLLISRGEIQLTSTFLGEIVQILIVTFRRISTFSLVKWSNYVKFLVIQLTSTFSWWTSLISHHKFHGNSHETTSDDQRFLGLQPAAETPNRSMGMGVRFFTASLNMSWRRGRDNQTSSWIYVCISIYLPIYLSHSVSIRQCVSVSVVYIDT